MNTALIFLSSKKRTPCALFVSLALAQMAQAQTTTDETVLPSVQASATINLSQNALVLDDKKAPLVDIRDLSAKTPSVAMVEQGKGASAGFAMRGVDKNRVAILVDGIAQAQSYVLDRGQFPSPANGGAINEIEIAHMREVALDQGASASAGSGALGGAVRFASKNAEDILRGAPMGGYLRTSFDGKNRSHATSVGVAGRMGDTRALLLYTMRNWQQTKAHDDVNKITQSVSRLSGFANGYDIDTGTPFRSWFKLCDTCQGRAYADIRTGQVPQIKNPNAMQADLLNKMQVQTHDVSAADYTGDARILPNPMQADSKAWLGKIEHDGINASWTLTAEAQKQRYQSRDMTVASYYGKEELRDFNRRTSIQAPSRGYYIGDVNEGLVIGYDAFMRSIAYSRTHFLQELHSKNRLSVVMQKPIGNANFEAFANYQDIHMASEWHARYCARYPAIDAHCRASLDKPWSAYQSEKNRYSERLLGVGADISAHQYGVNWQGRIGIDRVQSKLERSDVFAEFNETKFTDQPQPPAPNLGMPDNPRLVSANSKIVRTQMCNNDRIDLNNCATRIIDNDRTYAMFGANYQGDSWLWGANVRMDTQSFNSKDPLTATGKFSNIGAEYQIGKKLAIFDKNHSHKGDVWLGINYGNGFRVPAFYELYGYRSANFAEVPKLAPERSQNLELSMRYLGKNSDVAVRFFNQQYQDLIALGAKLHPKDSAKTYHNLHDVALEGVQISAQKTLWRNHEASVSADIAYHNTHLKHKKLKEGFTSVSEPMLDAIKPSGYVANLNYIRDDERFGITWRTTFQQAKAQDELVAKTHHGIYRVPSGLKGTRAWQTHDVLIHGKLGELSVRAGVHNLLDYRYSNWERARNLSANAVNPDTPNTNWLRYAAAGRSYSVGVEWAF